MNKESEKSKRNSPKKVGERVRRGQIRGLDVANERCMVSRWGKDEFEFIYFEVDFYKGNEMIGTVELKGTAKFNINELEWNWIEPRKKNNKKAL